MDLERLNSQSSSASNEVTLKEFILGIREWYRFLMSKWLIILFFGVLGGLVGLTYAYLKKPIYIASTTFVLEDGDKSGGIGQYAGLASMVGIDLGTGGGGIFEGDNILELYKSRTMIESTLLTQVEFNGRKQSLIDYYIYFNNFKDDWTGKPGLKDIHFGGISSFNRLQDSILGVIVKDIREKHLFVNKPDKKLSIIKAEVKCSDEFFAKVFNEQIVRKVNDFYIQTKTKKSLENVAILQQKTDSVRSIMNGAIYAGAKIADATPNLNPTRQVQRIAPMQRSQFSAETNKIILSELVKNLEMSKISLRKEIPLIQVIDKPVLPLEKEKLGKLKAIIVGGIVSVFCTLLYIFIRKIYDEAVLE